MERTLCENTMGGIDSAWRLWLVFCPIPGVDPDEFKQLEHDELPRPSQLIRLLCSGEPKDQGRQV